MNRTARNVAAVAFAAVLAVSIGFCSQQSSTQPAGNAAVVASSSPAIDSSIEVTTSTMPPASAPSPSTPLSSSEYCDQKYNHFCFTFSDASPDQVTVFTMPVKTTMGTMTARDYGGNAVHIFVYTPRASSPRAALKADRSWNFDPKPTTFKGDPATLSISKPDHPVAGDPCRNIALKVWHGGKIYVLLVVADNGPDSVQDEINSLRFLK